MEILEAHCEPEDLRLARDSYLQQCSRGAPSDDAIVSYSFALINSSDKNEIRKGIAGFEKLLRQGDSPGKRREYVYFLSLGYARIGEFDMAMRFADALIAAEPENVQAKRLREAIAKKARRNGVIGAAIFGGGVAVAAAGVLTILALVKK
ncbi:unnamed protein product [Caenorhabditis angaria]|uniref:Mitochondrial fission 1 protein n=1 Tax=Caenorhabditis angaria TaxID=860376 RepID=A0A9P1IWR6_9PELO|nr:unnamed protein product [Caenorhabditis angaria]